MESTDTKTDMNKRHTARFIGYPVETRGLHQGLEFNRKVAQTAGLYIMWCEGAAGQLDNSQDKETSW